MSLIPGIRLGPYEILAPIGVGGMGEVYSATDTRLRRTVAIKVLLAEKVVDAERKRRFLHEARAASALNHPNIVTLHDIANDGEANYLVMEFVPGTSLDKLITAKRLSLVEMIGYATQIASALAAAHAAGIVHRDIKPANVIVTPESQVKVLDFGLAKLVERAAPGPEGETQTKESALTEAGTVMGTVAYMSPEQASARPVDHRTDIFSLGVLLYEMLAGRRPFVGRSQVETMHAIINASVSPLSAQPPELQEILDKALAKNPNDRYQHAGDFELDLRRLRHGMETHSLPSLRTGVDPEGGRRQPLWWATAIGLIVLGIVAGWLTRGASQTQENPLANAHFARLTDFRGAEHGAAISPDGKFVSFLSDREGRFDVWISQVGSGRFTNLTQGKFHDLTSQIPVAGFSGDGTEIWLHEAGTQSSLLLIPLLGGPARVFLSRSPAKTPPVNAAWSPDGGRLVYHTADGGDPMFVADRSGANARQVFVDRPGMHNHFPVWSPDGRWIYFVRGNLDAVEQDIWRIAPEGGEPQRMTHHAGYVAYPAPIDSRRLLYVARDQDGSGPWLWVLDVDRSRSQRVSFGLEQYISVAASADGRRLAATVANPTASLWTIPLLDHPVEESDVRSFPLPTVRALAPRFGGSALFYLSSHGTGDGLWRFQDGQAVEVWKGSEGALLEPAAVSKDGRRTAIVLRKDGKLRLMSLAAEGGDLQNLGDTIDVRGAPSWSPDGKWVATAGDDGKGPGVFKIAVDGGAPVRLASGPAMNPVWSPDGTLIAYQGPDVGNYSPVLAVRPDGARVELPAVNLRRGGERVQFVPDGKALVYMTGLHFAQDFWLLDLATLKARPLTRFTNNATMRTFDITRDGKQIVFDRLRENSDVVLIDLPKLPK